ncbi:MAG: hypothetical protein ACNA78_10520 [Balneolaceae bacterium]
MRKPSNLQHHLVVLSTAGKKPYFIQRHRREAVIDALKWCCERRGLRLVEYALMPSQLCMVAGVRWGYLPDVMDGFATYTAKSLAGRDVAAALVWQLPPDYKPLITQEQVDIAIASIAKKPVEWGFVQTAEHYLYCSFHPQNPMEGWQVAVTDRS